MSIRADRIVPATAPNRGLHEENRTLYAVIKLVSSSLEVLPMLQGVVDLATEATGCHACFIYLLEDGRLTIRAASPVFSEAVGNVQFSVEEGLTGWVARHRTPEFIRERAMDDPRMKYVPLLEEERFQSMVAVPILSRSGATIGVIVLHTRAPHEFTEDAVKLLVHIASLVSGAIENAQLYDRERRRVDSLTELSGLAQEVAAASDAAELGPAVTKGTRRLLGAEVCQLYRLDRDGTGLRLLASSPDGASAPSSLSEAGLLLAALEGRGAPRARTLWPDMDVADLLVTPLSAGGERVGLLCAGSPRGRSFGDEDTEIARAVAHLSAVAIKRAELIEGLTNANIVKDLFEALAAGASAFAAAKAAEVRCDLTAPYMIVCAEPGAGREQSSGEWRATAEALGRGLSELATRAAIEAGPGPVRAILPLGTRRPQRIEEVVRACRELGQLGGAAVGISELRDTPSAATRAYREALDAATIGRALLGEGGAISYSQLGAYRYLVHIPPEDAPHDRMRAAVDGLIAYDKRRRTALLDTLERYLAERRSVIESARALFIHPNTLRQRLARIEELTGLALDQDDLLSLELAIKLARLHGRPSAGARSRGQGHSSSTIRNTGIFALRRTRWGSCVHMKSPENLLRSGSAAITIASQPCFVRLTDDRLGRLARADDVTGCFDPLAFEPPDGLRDDVALLGPLALGRKQAGVRQRERDPVDARDGEHVHARTGRLQQLDRAIDGGGRDRPPLRGDQDLLELSSVAVRRRMIAYRGPGAHGPEPSGAAGTVADGELTAPAMRLSSTRLRYQ